VRKAVGKHNPDKVEAYFEDANGREGSLPNGAFAQQPIGKGG